MRTRLILGAVFVVVMGCVTAPTPNKPERNFNAPSLGVDLSSNSSQVLDAVPAESLMEHFEMIDPQGRIVSYIAFTDTDVGGLVFVDHTLHGTLSHRDAQAFYSCRGYATVAPNHWAHEAAAWILATSLTRP